MDQNALLDEAIALHRSGQTIEAATHYRAVLEVDPEHKTAGHMLAVIERDAGNTETAQSILSSLIDRHTEDPELWFDLGLTLVRQGARSAAIKALTVAVENDPKQWPGWFQLGRLYATKANIEKSYACFLKAVELAPDNLPLELELARIEVDIGYPARALTRLKSLGAGHEANSTYSEVLYRAYFACGEVESAHRLYATANETTAQTIRLLHLEMVEASGALVDAIRLVDAEITNAPDEYIYAVRKAEILFKMGRFGDAWPLYRKRHQRFGPLGRAIEPLPVWQGTAMEGKRVVLTLDQGIGEQILFLKFLPELERIADVSCVELDAKLVPLAMRQYPHVKFVAWSKPADVSLSDSSADFSCALGDVGEVLRPDLASFSAPKTSLLPDPQLAASWKDRVGKAAGQKPVVGLCVVSHNPKGGGSDKSISFPKLAALAGLCHVQFLNLQHGAPRDRLNDWALEQGIAMLDFPNVDPMLSLEDHAALICATDIVVTISTVTAHLAGALGHPTLLLIPENHRHFWYWAEFNDQNLWYPSVQIMRVPAEAVAGDIAGAIEARLKALKG